MSAELKPSELIKKHGWIQGKSRQYSKLRENCLSLGEYRDSLCGMCLLSALQDAGLRIYDGAGSRSSTVYIKLQAEVKKRLGRVMLLSDFNDSPATTKEEVISVLEAVGL